MLRWNTIEYLTPLEGSFTHLPCYFSTDLPQCASKVAFEWGDLDDEAREFRRRRKMRQDWRCLGECLRDRYMYVHISILQKLLQTHPSIPELQLTFDFLRKVTLKNLLLFFHLRSSETPTAIRKEMTLEELDALLAKRKEDRRKEGDASRVHGGCSEAIHC